MKIIRINNIDRYDKQKVKINGWAYNSRRSGKIGFLMLRDGSGLMQCIIEKSHVGDAAFDLFKKVTQESSMSVIGNVVENSRAPGGYELFVDSIRDFFDMNDFTLVDTPIFTPNAAEGTSTLFETDYFDDSAYLCQTGQLYGEASAMAFGRHYNFGPCFRAEKSKTRRHLTEFWMVEPEIAYCNIDENMDWAEKLISYIIQQVLQHRSNELNILERNIDLLNRAQEKFPRISYTECIKMLNQSGNKIKWGEDFGSPEETYIANQYDRPVIVYGFPSDIKAFYMKRDPNNDKVVLGMDILAPEGYGEIVGGSERETDISVLLERIKEEKLNRNDYEWFLDLRKYGSVPHSGFGMGVERVVAWICGLSHIRETIPFARTMSRLNP